MNNGLETRYFLSALTGAGYYALHRQFLRPPERYFCILKGGPGCGKSTFLRCLNRLEEPDGGHVIFNGKEVTDHDIDHVRQKMGMVFQHFNLFPHLTVKKNLELAPSLLKLKDKEAISKRADELLARVGLADKAGQDYLTLSGGEKQLCILARTIAEDAPLLLLDEPDSALDLANRSRMTALLAQQPDLQGCVFLLGDQPCLTRQTLEALAIGAAPDTIRRPALLEYVKNLKISYPYYDK